MENRPEALAGLHILVVEDEVMVAMMLEDMLQDFGCIVDLASNIDDALASIRRHAPDGVLLDMNIHGRKTIAVAEELVSRSVPFLLVTGYGASAGDPPVIKTASRLQKPFVQGDLGQRMAEVFVT
jgi:CheY-like chemotaxis protein